MALCSRRTYAYSRVDNEDPDEKIHRRAQFLIYKVLEQADSRRKPSFLRIRLCRLKVKIGRKLKLRKSMVVSFCAARVRVHKKILKQLKAWRLLFSRGGTNTATLPPPLFT
ncbi:hypothetical protein SLE2022_393160 [Rubroshorea leprosula]